MALLRYDPDSDSMYINISSKKAGYTLEFNDDINIDMSETRRVVGVEVLDASKVLSSLFHKKITREQIRRFLTCHIRDEKSLYLDFELSEHQKESVRASMALPRPLDSPVLSVS